MKLRRLWKLTSELCKNIIEKFIESRKMMVENGACLTSQSISMASSPANYLLFYLEPHKYALKYIGYIIRVVVTEYQRW